MLIRACMLNRLNTVDEKLFALPLVIPIKMTLGLNKTTQFNGCTNNLYCNTKCSTHIKCCRTVHYHLYHL